MIKLIKLLIVLIISQLNISLSFAQDENTICGAAYQANGSTAAQQSCDRDINTNTILYSINPWWEMDLSADVLMGYASLTTQRTAGKLAALQQSYLLISDMPIADTSLANLLADPSVHAIALNNITPFDDVANNRYVLNVPIQHLGRYVRLQIPDGSSIQVSLYEAQVVAERIDQVYGSLLCGAAYQANGSTVAQQSCDRDINTNTILYSINPWWEMDLSADVLMGYASLTTLRTASKLAALQQSYLLISDMPIADTSLANLLADSSVHAIALNNITPFDDVVNNRYVLNVPVQHLGRYVRIQIPDGSSIQVSLYEAQVVAERIDQVYGSLLCGAAYQANGSTTAQQACDRDINTSSILYSINPWWEMDLSADVLMGYASLTTQRTAGKLAALQQSYLLISDMPIADTSLANLLADPSVHAIALNNITPFDDVANNRYVLNVPIQHLGRYVRLQIPDGSSIQVSLYEAQVVAERIDQVYGSLLCGAAYQANGSTVAQQSCDRDINTNTILYSINPWWEMDLSADVLMGYASLTTLRTASKLAALQQSYLLISDMPIADTSLANLLADSSVHAIALNNITPFDDVVNNRYVLNVPVQHLGRYVRIQIPDGSSIQVSLYEAQVVAERIDQVYGSLLCGAAYQANGSTTAQQACDRDINTSSILYSINPWWEMDMGKEWALSYVSITTTKHTGYLSNLKQSYLLVSDTLMADTTLANLLTDPSVHAIALNNFTSFDDIANNRYVLNVPIQHLGRYVRLQIPDGSSIQPDLHEVQIKISDLDLPPMSSTNETICKPSSASELLAGCMVIEESGLKIFSLDLFGADLIGALASEVVVTYNGQSVPIFIDKENPSNPYLEFNDRIYFYGKNAIDHFYDDLKQGISENLSGVFKPLPEMLNKALYGDRSVYKIVQDSSLQTLMNTDYSSPTNIYSDYYTARVATKGGGADHFYNFIQFRGDKTYDFMVDNLYASGGDATLSMYHHANYASYQNISITINDNPYLIPGITPKQNFDFPSSDLIDGENTIDMSYEYTYPHVQYVILKYPRKFIAVDDALSFTSATNTGAYKVKRFTGDSNINAVRELSNGDFEYLSNVQVPSEADGTFSAVFHGSSEEGTYHVFDSSSSNIMTIPATQHFEPINEGDAEYIIISPAKFLDGLERFVDQKSLTFPDSVKLVNVEDIYAQYGHSNFGYMPIADYVRYAHSNLNTKYVLFVGDSRDRSRDYDLQMQSKDVLPHCRNYLFIDGPVTTSYLVDEIDELKDMFIFDDGPGVSNTSKIQFSKYEIPPCQKLFTPGDLFVGRWPVENSVELDAVIDKTIAFEQKTFSGEALIGYHDHELSGIVTYDNSLLYLDEDGNLIWDAYYAEALNDVKTKIVDEIILDMTSPPNHGWTNIEEMHLSALDDIDQTQDFVTKRAEFVQKLSDGMDLMVYVGSTDWSLNTYVGLLDTPDIPLIQNYSNPYIAVLYDRNSANYLGEGEVGWEENRYIVSGASGESLLVSPTSGAAAVIGMTTAYDFTNLYNEVDLITNAYNKPIGSLKERHETTNHPIYQRRYFMTILGDPSLVIKK